MLRVVHNVWATLYETLTTDIPVRIGMLDSA